MDRRVFIVGGIATVTTPLVAVAQQDVTIVRIGFLSLIPGENATLMTALLERLKELGYLEGKNLLSTTVPLKAVRSDSRNWPMDWFRARPDVLIAGAGTLTALALKAATSTIPIVFTSVGDPVGADVVSNIAKPGGNITGLTGQSAAVSAKRLQLLREVVPDSRIIALLMNPATPFATLDRKESLAAAASAHVQLEVIQLRTPEELQSKFALALTTRPAGMIVSSDPLTYALRYRIADLAAKSRLPAIYGHRDHPDAGGLMSYGASRRAMYRRAAEYADKILKGLNNPRASSW